jgi:hypothetical protein
VWVEVVIADFCASVTIHQTFVNVEEQPIEGTYHHNVDVLECKGLIVVVTIIS